jgi:hypothetical protein
MIKDFSDTRISDSLLNFMIFIRLIVLMSLFIELVMFLKQYILEVNLILLHVLSMTLFE